MTTMLISPAEHFFGDEECSPAQIQFSNALDMFRLGSANGSSSETAKAHWHRASAVRGKVQKGIPAPTDAGHSPHALMKDKRNRKE